MKKAIPYWQMVGFIFTAVVGTLLHFLFDWAGGNPAVALFSAVNESIWEHLKLLFYPMIAFGTLEYFYWGKDVESFWCIKLIGILTGLVLIPVLYYTYTGVFGVNADWLNITIFFLVAMFAYWLETKLFQRKFDCPVNDKLALGLILLVVAVFTVFTFLPPHIPFLQDPITGSYGFIK